MRIVNRRLRLYTSKTNYIKLDNLILMMVSIILFIVIPKHQQEETEISVSAMEFNSSVPLMTKVIKPTKYRMTYFYPGDGMSTGTVTASGLSTQSFKINDRGWYTYGGKLVVATASNRLKSWQQYKNSNQKTYKLYDELLITINDKEYDAIVLDVCGACMKSAKIDLFVKDKKSGLDTTVYVNQK